jgi:hypothetical protein
MSFYTVTATRLNIRRTPMIMPGNVVGVLNQGERAERVGESGTDWLKVRTPAVEGFVASKYLAPAAAAGAGLPVVAFSPPAVDFPPHAQSRRDTNVARHCPLSELTVMPRQSGQPIESRHAELHKIVTDLAVERSRRYAPTTVTYCNIYAYDFLHLAGVYLPRVWWTSKALLALASGQTLDVIYEKTVREMRANDLHLWLHEWGDKYGWKPAAGPHALQAHVNAGGTGVITAQRVDLNLSGHITVVLPETNERRANRVDGTVVSPLQSQAGRVNRDYFARIWWEDASLYQAHGFWAHD